MKLSSRRELRLAPLVACVSLAFGGSCAWPASANAQSAGSMTRSGAIALHDELRNLTLGKVKAPAHSAAVLIATTCADSANAGSLRSLVAAAGEGDTIDLSKLKCSKITLQQGVIPILLNDLTIVGPGAAGLVIDGANADRVFIHGGYGTLTLSGLTVRHGSTRVSGYHITGGGCIASAGYVLLEHSTISDCYASGEGVYGGGVFAYSLEMYTSTLSRSVGLGKNTATGTAVFGGGAYVNALHLTDSTISGNRAAHDLDDGQSSYDIGGGVFSNLGGTIFGSTIEGNYSSAMGGGVATFGGYLSVIDSTVSGNVAQTAHGGGLDLRTFYPHNVSNSTIANNHAAVGAGIYLRGSSQPLTLQSTLISGNVAAAGNGPDLDAGFAVNVIGANNLVGVVGANVSLPVGTLHGEPHLRALADNGGPTRTHALTYGSPALDAGNNLAGLTNDQRGAGFPRMLGTGVDIGAYEGFAVPAPPAADVPAVSPWWLALLASMLAWTGLRRRPNLAHAVSLRLNPKRRSSQSPHPMSGSLSQM